MGSPYIGEIRMGGWNFAPVGWAFCDGQLLPISQNVALFTLIGTTYGGDGQTTFALPDLRSRIPIHQGSGLSLGENGGVETVTLIDVQLPAHRHSLVAQSGSGQQSSPTNGFWAASSLDQFSTSTSNLSSMAAGSIGSAGGNQPHSNLAPYLVINFVISLFGIFPSQS